MVNSENKDENNTLISKNDVISFTKTVILFVFLWLFVRGTIIEAFKIPSGSMIPTLQIGDYLLVNKLSYGIRASFFDNTLWQYSTPKRGDVVVFTKEVLDDTDQKGMNFIKRVIGVAGDKVKIKGTSVFVNGEKLDEPYARWIKGGKGFDIETTYTVPEGHLFLLGDNRDSSFDSRFWKQSFLPVSRVKGRALFIYFSYYDLKRTFTIIR